MGEHDDLLRRLRSREPGQAVTDVTNGSGDRSSDPGTLVANRNWVPVATMRVDPILPDGRPLRPTDRVVISIDGEAHQMPGSDGVSQTEVDQVQHAVIPHDGAATIAGTAIPQHGNMSIDVYRGHDHYHGTSTIETTETESIPRITVTARAEPLQVLTIQETQRGQTAEASAGATVGRNQSVQVEQTSNHTDTHTASTNQEQSLTETFSREGSSTHETQDQLRRAGTLNISSPMTPAGIDGLSADVSTEDFGIHVNPADGPHISGELDRESQHQHGDSSTQRAAVGVEANIRSGAQQGHERADSRGGRTAVGGDHSNTQSRTAGEASSQTTTTRREVHPSNRNLDVQVHITPHRPVMPMRLETRDGGGTPEARRGVFRAPDTTRQ